jgi:hypothetical protein
MNMLSTFKTLLATPEQPALGPARRANVAPIPTLEASLAAAFAGSPITPPVQDVIRAVVLLWHDHLEAAHRLAQSVETSDGSYAHGLMHRREPDYDNARYWFRRVRRHGAYPELAKRSQMLLAGAGEEAFAHRLRSRGEWDALAFVGLCEAAESGSLSGVQARLCRQLQALEMENLLEHLCPGTA